MFISPWAYLRRKAAEAVALGVADGLAAVAPGGEELPHPDLDSLRQLAAGQVAGSPRALAPAQPDEEAARPRGRRA